MKKSQNTISTVVYLPEKSHTLTYDAMLRTPTTDKSILLPVTKHQNHQVIHNPYVDGLPSGLTNYLISTQQPRGEAPHGRQSATRCAAGGTAGEQKEPRASALNVNGMQEQSKRHL